MNQFDENDPLVTGTKPQVRRWIRGAIDLWLASADGFSFSPYQHRFRASMEPEDVLFFIYSEIRKTAEKRTAVRQASYFHVALEEIITEPQVYEAEPAVFEIVLRAGEKIGCTEVIDGLRTLARKGKLQTIGVGAGAFNLADHAYSLFDIAASTVIAGIFASKETAGLCKDLITCSGPNHLMLPELFRRLNEIEPQNLIANTTAIANEIQDFLLGRIEYGDVEFEERERLVLDIFLGTSKSIDLSAMSRSELAALAQSPAAWLLSQSQFELGETEPPAFAAVPKLGKQAMAQRVQAAFAKQQKNMTPAARRVRLEEQRAGARSAGIVRDELEAAREGPRSYA